MANHTYTWWHNLSPLTLRLLVALWLILFSATQAGYSKPTRTLICVPKWLFERLFVFCNAFWFHFLSFLLSVCICTTNFNLGLKTVAFVLFPRQWRTGGWKSFLTCTTRHGRSGCPTQGVPLCLCVLSSSQ